MTYAQTLQSTAEARVPALPQDHRRRPRPRDRPARPLRHARAGPAHRPDPAQRLVPAAAPPVLQQGQRLPDLRQVRHRRDLPARAAHPAGPHRAAHRRTPRGLRGPHRTADERGQHLARRSTPGTRRPRPHHRSRSSTLTPADGTVRAVRGAGVAARTDAITSAQRTGAHRCAATPTTSAGPPPARAPPPRREPSTALREMIRRQRADHLPRPGPDRRRLPRLPLPLHADLRQRVEHLRAQQQTSQPQHPSTTTRRAQQRRPHPHRPDQRAQASTPGRGRRPQPGAGGRPRREPDPSPPDRPPSQQPAPRYTCGRDRKRSTCTNAAIMTAYPR